MMLIAAGLPGCGGDGDGSADPAAVVVSTAATQTVAPIEAPSRTVVFYNPYAKVDFALSPRLLAQHHDHAGVSQTKLIAYDAAGYNVIGLQDYSGNPRADYAWTSRRWPPEKWLPKDFMSRLKNLELFLPNAEEVGLADLHITSTFVDSYIESELDPLVPPQPWQYRTGTQMLKLIKEKGGVACLAHPFEPLLDTNYWSSRELPCVEVYSAYAEGLKDQGNPYFTSRDRNKVLVSNWDRLLRENSRTLGIAVNDHFGPDTPPFVKVSARARDSGKILVFAPEVSLDAYQRAFRDGAFFAVIDRGATKGNFPDVRKVVVDLDTLFIDTPDNVKWISNFGEVGDHSTLRLAELHWATSYVRAEISNADGSVIHTQAFSIRQRGDLDGDGYVDAFPDDLEICRQSDASSAPAASLSQHCGGPP